MGFIAAARNSANGLGYYDGIHTWVYDSARSVYLNENGEPAGTETGGRTPPPPPPAPQETGGRTPPPPAPTPTPAPPPATAVALKAGRLSFQNLTTGNSAVIIAGRDQWRITITGASPGLTVSAIARKNGGAPSLSGYGVTDAAGNWSMTGSSDAADIGAWVSEWSVSSALSGTLIFQIAAPPPPPPPAKPPAGEQPPTPPSGGTEQPAGGSEQPSGQLPSWLLPVAAVGILLLLIRR